MKEEIVNCINRILFSGDPLTDVQVRIIAYWEFVDYQNGGEAQ